MNKKNVTVLFGGQSSEHGVSCKSAKTVIDGICAEKYNVNLVGITEDGGWYLYQGDRALIPTDKWMNDAACYPISIELGGARGLYADVNGVRTPVPTDVFFPVLHGKFGEDGTIQGLFEMLGVPYVGCGVASSSSSMDKSFTKRLVEGTGIKQADYVLVDRYNARDLDAVVRESVAKLGFPMFVKPCSSGSSIGISKARNEDELRAGITEALRHDGRVLIEEFIRVRELECAVIDLGDRLAAEVGEVIAADEFYDFDSKYNNAASVTNTHPDIPEALEKQIQESAKIIFRTLDCKSLSRVDFFLDLDTGDLIFNEINTLPGFTNIGMYPMLAKKHGFDLPTLIDKLIESV